jgi:hypothetical protein
MSGTFVMDFWISAIWQDSRLRFSHIDPCRRNLSLDHDMEPRLWSPNVCIVNSKSTKVHDSPKPNILLMVRRGRGQWIALGHSDLPQWDNLAELPNPLGGPLHYGAEEVPAGLHSMRSDF